MIKEKDVLDALKKVIEPDLGKNIVELGLVTLVSTSDKWGTLFKVKPPSLNKDAGISVRQEFFAPDIGIEPESLFPPSIKIFSFN